MLVVWVLVHLGEKNEPMARKINREECHEILRAEMAAFGVRKKINQEQIIKNMLISDDPSDTARRMLEDLSRPDAEAVKKTQENN